eukprot:1330883-Amorphochlora_amoeboformis.AAC.1
MELQHGLDPEMDNPLDAVDDEKTIDDEKPVEDIEDVASEINSFVEEYKDLLVEPDQHPADTIISEDISQEAELSDSHPSNDVQEPAGGDTEVANTEPMLGDSNIAIGLDGVVKDLMDTDTKLHYDDEEYDNLIADILELAGLDTVQNPTDNPDTAGFIPEIIEFASMDPVEDIKPELIHSALIEATEESKLIEPEIVQFAPIEATEESKIIEPEIIQFLSPKPEPESQAESEFDVEPVSELKLEPESQPKPAIRQEIDSTAQIPPEAAEFASIQPVSNPVEKLSITEEVEVEPEIVSFYVTGDPKNPTVRMVRKNSSRFMEQIKMEFAKQTNEEFQETSKDQVSVLPEGTNAAAVWTVTVASIAGVLGLLGSSLLGSFSQRGMAQV